MENQELDYHLEQAFSHLRTAIDQSVSILLQDGSAKKQVGQKWEKFLGQFFSTIRDKGKESKINLLGLISFPRLR